MAVKKDKSGTNEVPFKMTDPERIPAERYYDQEFYDLERERLWPHVWQMACRLEQIPEVGDWVEYSNLGQSVLVVRTRDGVKSFHNACRHRGVPIAGGMGTESGKVAHGNCSKSGFICPFHGWRWNMDGENTFVYGRQLFSEKQLDSDDINLRPCRSEVALGCVFINFDDDAPSFRDTIGPLVDRLEAHGAANMNSEWWVATVLPANWKLAMEAFQEGYHVVQTHPQLGDAVPSVYGMIYGPNVGDVEKTVNEDCSVKAIVERELHHMELLSEGMGGMIHAKEVEIARSLLDSDLPDDPAQAVPMWYGLVQDQITEQLRARGERIPDVKDAAMNHPLEALEFIFPHYFLLPAYSFTSMSSYRIRPLGPESCLFELWSLTHFPEGEEPPVPMEPTLLPYDSLEFPPIPRQDYSNIPIQQKGLHAKGFEYMRLAKGKEGLVSNYQQIIDGHLANADPEKLAKATQTLGGNFDREIVDLGF